MARIVRTDSAKSDLTKISDYIAADSVAAAERWLDEIDQTLAVLSQHPFNGERVDHLAAGVRRHCCGNYLLFYKPILDGIGH